MLSLLGLMVGLAASPAAARPAPLEGTAWKVLLDRGPKDLWASDVIVFEDGRFAAMECLSWGFTPATYRERLEGGRVHWSAELSSSDGRTWVWTGVREGRRMSGKLSLADPSGDPVEVPWRAVLRPPPAAVPGF